MSDLYKLLISNIKHTPTPAQTMACRAIAEFIARAIPGSAFLLKGYAGTGKTTLIGALVRTLTQCEITFEIFAPTGRAAKVASIQTATSASTIHRGIYSISMSKEGTGQFRLRPNDKPVRVYIIDESSMISDRTDAKGALFAQNSLLADLATFITSSHESVALFVGDTAQLPPVMETKSPALDAGSLERHFRPVTEITMGDVVRQEKQSGILHYATQIRNQIDEQPYTYKYPIFSGRKFPDIRVISRGSVLEYIESTRSRWGANEVMILCRSNGAANRFNQAIRKGILGFEGPLVAGDRIMVCKNSYFWTEREPSIPFIANGDSARLCRVYNLKSLYGMRFAEVDLILEDYPDTPEVSATVMLDVLDLNEPALSWEAMSRLRAEVSSALTPPGKRPPSKEKLRRNPYLNALQLKYGYAATCHKAQGGQWDAVFIDCQWIKNECTIDDLRWFYTAITRAAKEVYLIAPPSALLESEDEFSY